MSTSGEKKSQHKCNHYKLLMCTIPDWLNPGEASKLQSWANQKLSTNVSSDVEGVLRNLNQEKIICISDLSQLKEFFWLIQRVEFVHLIDRFQEDDFAPLHLMNSSRNLRGGIQRAECPPSVHSRNISTTTGSSSCSTTVASTVDSFTRDEVTCLNRGLSRIASGASQSIAGSTTIHSRTESATTRSRSSSTTVDLTAESPTAAQGVLMNSNFPLSSRNAPFHSSTRSSSSSQFWFGRNEESPSVKRFCFPSVPQSLDETEGRVYLQERNWRRVGVGLSRLCS